MHSAFENLKPRGMSEAIERGLRSTKVCQNQLFEIPRSTVFEWADVYSVSTQSYVLLLALEYPRSLSWPA